MSFTQAYVTSVNPPVQTLGSLLLSWNGTLPAGQCWQVYLGETLAWHGFQNRTHVPAPTATVQITIGSVDVADAGTAFLIALPPQPKLRTTLSWQGGRFESPDGDVKGFHVYGEDTPGGGIDYTNLLADIPLFTGRIATDGFGMGGFGQGGFGYAAGSYSWTSGPLKSGTYSWTVVPYDSAGNEGTPSIATDVIVAPPSEPPPFPGTSTRLKYSVVGYGETGFGTGGFGLPEVTLTWLASTG